MRRYILTSLFALSCLGAYCQNQVTDSSATCVAYWRNKATKIFMVSQSKEKKEPGKEPTRSDFSYEAHLKVIDSTAEGYTIEWTTHNYKTKDPLGSAIANNLMEGRKMIYKTNDVGSFKELVNWEEVRDFWTKLMDLSLPKDDTSIQAVREKTLKMFGTKQAVESILIREIQLYHSPFGAEFSRSGQTLATELANFTGGKPFPATVTVKATGIDKQKDRCQIIYDQKFDKEKGRIILIDILNRFAGDKLPENKLNEEIASVEISDKSEFDLQLSTGWLTRASFKRTVNINGVSQTESVLIAHK